MNVKGYALAGWLAITGAVILVPEIGLSLLLDKISGTYPGAKAIITWLNIVGLAISVYILYMFRSLLNERYNFHGTDTLIMILIGTNVLFAVIGLLGLIPELTVVMSVLVLVLFVPFGVVNIVFAVKLLKLQDDLFGLLKPFAYTTIAAGICGASVILMPLGMLAATAALIMQGMIFLRAKEEVQFV
jgi:hypothetical protein